MSRSNETVQDEPLTEIAALGVKINHLRMEQGVSVHELARRSGVSAGMISQIERGMANPSFNVISRLASALNFQLGILFEQKPIETNGCVVRKADRMRINIPDPNFLFELLTPNLDYDLEFVWVESAPGSSTQDSPFSHEGQECGLVLQGTLEIHIGDECFLLQTGDSITIEDCRVPHWYHNIGQERVLSIWAITPPTF